MAESAPVDIYEDIFANYRNSKADDPRYVAVDDPAAKKVIPLLASPEDMAYILADVVRGVGPGRAECDRLKTQGEHIDPVSKSVRKGHRIRIEYGERPLTPYLGVINRSHWAATVLRLLDVDNATSFIGHLKTAQPNGDWVPIHVKTEFGKTITNDGRTRIRSKEDLGTIDGVSPKQAEWHDDFGKESETPAVRHSAVSVDVLQYIIVWCDRLNGRDLPPMGPDGKPILDQIVHVQNNTDPALIEAIGRMGQNNGGGGGMDRLADAMLEQGDRLGAVASAVQALAERPAPTVVIPERRKPGRPPKHPKPATPDSDKS